MGRRCGPTASWRRGHARLAVSLAYRSAPSRGSAASSGSKSYPRYMSDAARRWERKLSEDDRSRLETAHSDLRQAVAAYDPFVGGPLEAGQPIPMHDAAEMRAAQEAVEAAEDRLWRLREELLGWVRPSWAPSATLTSDWFSTEDAVYDDLHVTSAS